MKTQIMQHAFERLSHAAIALVSTLVQNETSKNYS